jgi:hypothetical protein
MVRTALAAGCSGTNYEANSNFCLFEVTQALFLSHVNVLIARVIQVQLSLTDDGIEHKQDVLAIVFAYMALIRSSTGEHYPALVACALVNSHTPR